MSRLLLAAGLALTLAPPPFAEAEESVDGLIAEAADLRSRGHEEPAAEQYAAAVALAQARNDLADEARAAGAMDSLFSTGVPAAFRGTGGACKSRRPARHPPRFARSTCWRPARPGR